MDYYVFNITTQTAVLAMQYQIGVEGESYNYYNGGLTNVASGSQSFPANQVEKISLLACHSIGSRFEDLISDGDVFGIRMNHPSVGNFRGIGVKIVWRF